MTGSKLKSPPFSEKKPKVYNRVKSTKEIDNLRMSGRILAEILQSVSKMAVPGVTGKEIDRFAGDLARKAKAKCVFNGYNGYPANICISTNAIVNHGIPDDTAFKKGDVISFDFGISYNGMITDSALTRVIGEAPSGDKKRLLEATEDSLYAGLEEIEANCRVGDISFAISEVLNQARLGIVEELVGHGVGHMIHEQPDIPNKGRAGLGPTLKKGMTIAVEPITTLGSGAVEFDKDGWTIRTADNTLSAQFEHTVLVTEDGCEILTKL